MKITITGSLGHISKPLTQELLANGHAVTVISSKAEKKEEIEAMGAFAAIGSLHDREFLAQSFNGSEAVYTMVPPGNYMDHNLDLLAYYTHIGQNYFYAIKQAGVSRVVNLSTIGGNLSSGNGILVGAHQVEGILNELPEEVSLTHMRPNSFYYNLLGYIPMIKSSGVIAANYGGEDIIPWVSPIDIASAVSQELCSSFKGRKARSVASEDLSGNQTAEILGAAIGMPALRWVVVSDEQTLEGLVSIGMNPKIAAGLVEMYAALHSGLLAQDYYSNKPEQMGKVKMSDYAKEFAAAFNKI